MVVMSDADDPVWVHTMTKGEGKAEVIDLKRVAGAGRGFRSDCHRGRGPGSARGGDKRGDRRRQGRTQRVSAIVRSGHLQPITDHPSRDELFHRLLQVPLISRSPHK